MVVPASKTKGLQLIGIAVISSDQSCIKLEDILPANILAFASFPGPILSAAHRVLGGGACANETRLSCLRNLSTLSVSRTRRSGVSTSLLAIVASRNRRDWLVREWRRDGRLLGFPLHMGVWRVGEHGKVNRPFRNGTLDDSSQGVCSYTVLLATASESPLDLSEALEFERSEPTRSRIRFDEIQ